MTNQTRNLAIVALVSIVTGYILGGYISKTQTSRQVTITESVQSLPPDPLPFSKAAVDTSSEPAAPVTSGDAVFITKSGTKYHADGCRFLSKSKIPVALPDAKSRGFKPCSKCDPPT